MGSFSGMKRIGEFLPPMPPSHSVNLSPLGTDFADDMICKTSHSLVPKIESCRYFLAVGEKNRSSINVR